MKDLTAKQKAKIQRAIRLLEQANFIIEELDSQNPGLFFNDMSGAATCKRRLRDLIH